MTYRYLTESSPKTIKGEAAGYLTGILYLAPSDLSGWNVCPNATPQCIALCLNTAGRAGIFRKGETSNIIQRARVRRTLDFFRDRKAFIYALALDIQTLVNRATARGLKPAVRLNGTSDLRFDRFAGDLFAMFPDVQFYDYTKDIGKMIEFLAGILPVNYHVTFSRSENSSLQDLADILDVGGNVAVVYRGDARQLPRALGFRFKALETPIVDGDEHDLRFLDARGAIVALKAKGRARKHLGGFVVDVTCALCVRLGETCVAHGGVA